jgi:hypothetical protein
MLAFLSSVASLNKYPVISAPPPPGVDEFIHLPFDNSLTNIGNDGATFFGSYLEYNNINQVVGTHCMRFTGAINSTQYIEPIADISMPDIYLGGLTLSMHLYPRAAGRITSAHSHVFNIEGDNDSFCKLYLRQTSTNGTQFRIGADSHFFTLSMDTWSHVVITTAYQLVSVYVNGTKVIDNQSTTFYMTPRQFINVMRIGRHTSTGLGSFNGDIDDFRMYNYRMNDTQVAGLAI